MTTSARGPRDNPVTGRCGGTSRAKDGLAIGDRLIEETVDRLIARADSAGVDQLGTWGLVHQRNAASQALVERQGFDYLIDYDDDLREW